MNNLLEAKFPRRSFFKLTGTATGVGLLGAEAAGCQTRTLEIDVDRVPTKLPEVVAAHFGSVFALQRDGNDIASAVKISNTHLITLAGVLPEPNDYPHWQASNNGIKFPINRTATNGAVGLIEVSPNP